MDFKGIAWAGNVYQKFEAMCLEVEEVMYEDTVKYVENQAQKVGQSVKKFYSEVVGDFLPPSSVDPVKVSGGDLSLNPYTFTDFNKKPKPYILDSDINFNEKKNEDKIISKQSSQVVVQNVRSDLCSTKSKKIGIKRITQNARPSKISRPVSQISSSEIVNENTRMAKIDAPVESSASDKVVSIESARQKEIGIKRIFQNDRPSNIISRPISQISSSEIDNENTRVAKFDAPVESSASDTPLPVESVRQKEGDSECTSSSSGVLNEFIDMSKNNTPCQIGSSIPCQIGSSIRSNACEVESVDKTVMASDEGKKIEDSSISQSSPHISGVVSKDMEVKLSDEDNFDMEVIENEEFAYPRVQISENFNLEETCVLVEGDNIHFSPEGTKKHKSYKKKFREALSLKLRSTKKQVRDQSVSPYKDFVGENQSELAIPALTLNADEKKSPCVDLLESEWELL